jgi:hypothetical protein
LGVELEKMDVSASAPPTQARIPMKQAKSPQNHPMKGYCRLINILYIVNIDKL